MKTLQNTVIDTESGRKGYVTAWADDNESALVQWDGWMGTTIVKRNEMVVIADMIKEALEVKRNNEYKALCASLDHPAGIASDTEYYSRRLRAIDFALDGLKK